MKQQYVFSFLAAAATAALFWHPSPPSPVTSTREHDGLQVLITTHPEEHRFEQLVVPSLENPTRNAFQLPRSYIRKRLCAGDEMMLAQVQSRLMLSPGEGEVFGELGADCAPGSAFCAHAAAALQEDAGMSADELQFFAESLVDCDTPRFAALRADLRLPLTVRAHAWSLLADAGAWSPELAAALDELAVDAGGTSPIQQWYLATAIAAVDSNDPGFLDASVRLMDSLPVFARALQDSPAPSLRLEACSRTSCAHTADSGVDPREELAACALQSDDDSFCLDGLAMLDWSMARMVVQRVKYQSRWAAALREFETREAFDEFARALSVTPAQDGGFSPSILLGELNENEASLFSDDGLGLDEVAARWARQAPELAGAFFVETGEPDGGVRLSSHFDQHLFAVSVRYEKENLDGRAALALLNAMAAERGSTKRFFFIEADWAPMVHFADPGLISKLVERRLIVLDDPDAARHRDL